MPALISAGGAAAARRALAKTLVHVYDRTPITSADVDGDEVSQLGTPTVGVACRYEAGGRTARDAAGLVTVSVPSLTVAHDDPLAIGDRVTNLRNADGVALLDEPLVVTDRLDDDPLGVTLQRVYALHGADPREGHLMDALLVGLVWLLIYALGIALACYIAARLIAQFAPGAASFTWIVWCIGGLILIILALRLFAPLLGG